MHHFPQCYCRTSPEVRRLLTIWPRNWVWIWGKFSFDSSRRCCVNIPFPPQEWAGQMHLNEGTRGPTGRCQWAEETSRVSNPSCRFSRGKVRKLPSWRLQRQRQLAAERARQGRGEENGTGWDATQCGPDCGSRLITADGHRGVRGSESSCCRCSLQ